MPLFGKPEPYEASMEDWPQYIESICYFFCANGIEGDDRQKNESCFVQHSINLWIFPSVYILIFCLGLPVNCVALYAAYKQVKRKNELGVYLFNLTLADLLYILTLPFWIDFAVHNDDWRAGNTMCQICSFLTQTNLYASSVFLCCISFDRYLGVVHPLQMPRVRTMRAAILISCVVWASQTAFNLELLIETEVDKDTDRHILCYDIYPIESWKAKLNYFRITFGFLIPLVLIIAFHCRIYNALRGNMATLQHEKRRAAQLMLGITVGFTVCFTPFHAMLLVRSIMEKNCDVANSIFIPYRLSIALVSLNCILDPVLYCFVSEISRKDILLFTLRRRESWTNEVRNNQIRNMSATTIL
ncbi:ovarian cancer G-protein coupled receptor 1-like isoform X1 [Scyliorhinus canicula]|uniref:ovarian cancer G-protein coupled receptor 1-like isoform X1 n=1 Tax=Scyliorhinus canicula TaxID=7830 RepID=UPI0018F473ED|nr:ovarian cancer G-protein coupled receptor 1-like isoform X1 [Scyliorhinus canicula]